MKIILVITKGDVGGAQQSVFALAKGLKEAGHEVSVGIGEGNYLRDQLEKIQIPYIGLRWLRRTMNPFYNIFFIFEIKNLIDKNRLDVIHFNSSNALIGVLGAKLAKNKITTLFTFHGLSVLDPNYKCSLITKIIYWTYFKLFCLFVDKKIFVSEINLKTAEKIKLIKDGHILYNGIDEKNLNFLSRDEAKNFLSKKIGEDLSDKFIIGSIARLAYQKNFEFLIKIFPNILKINKDAIAIIIGDGPERKKYIKLLAITGMNGKIYFIGEIKNAYKYIKSFNLFVLPSRYEGLPITLIETLFSGIPMLVTRVGESIKILPEEQIYILDDKNEFIEKFKKLQTAQPIVRKIDQFTLKTMTNNYIKLIKY